MKENQQKAFDFASETTKQLINIATAIVAFTVTFSKDIVGNVGDDTKSLLAWTWGVFIISVLSGIATMMALTGALEAPIKPVVQKATVLPEAGGKAPASINANQQDNDVEFSIYDSGIRVFSLLQILTFIIALIMTAIFGYKSLSANSASKIEHYKVLRRTQIGGDSIEHVDTLYIPIK